MTSALEPDEDDEHEEGRLLGPDERDMDLLDGLWEARHYAGHEPARDWRAISVGLALLALMGIVVPAVLVLLR